MSANKFDVIVIGSGLGGLSCALHFARSGRRVLVLEKQPKVGGYCQNYKRGPYSFDVSLHVLSAMDPDGGLRALLEHMQVFDKLEIVRHEPMFTSIFPKATYRLPGGTGPAKDYLKSLFPREATGIDRFLDYMGRIVADNTKLFWEGVADLENFFPSRYFKKTYTDLLNDCTKDPRLHGLLGQLWQSTGLPNSRCAANWAAEVFGSHILSGNYYLKGGGQSLSDAMARTLFEAGSEVRTSALVTKIHTEDKVAKGVELQNGEQIQAPVIVANASPYQTYFSLIGKEHLARAFVYKLEHLEPSSSLLTLYMGLDCPAADVGAKDHTLFVNETFDNTESYDRAMAEDYHLTDYVMSDYTEEAGANHPPGHGIVQVLEVAPGDKWTEISRGDYDEKKKRVTDTILKKVSKRFPDLEKHIAVAELGTPRTMMLATRNPWGSVYGWAQTPKQADNYRFGVASIFKGLYFTGAWSRGGGGGYMGAIVNGRVAWRTAMEKERMEVRETRIKTFPREKAETVKKFDDEKYEFKVEGGINQAQELSSEAAVDLFSRAANSFMNDRLEFIRTSWKGFEDASRVFVSFFQMRFLFVPFVEIEKGDKISVEVSFTPKDPGKGEFLLVAKTEAGKKAAEATGRVLVRK